MTQYQFRLPDIGEGVAEAEVVAWHVKPGQRIAEDQEMVDVMTDKATVELSSPVTGIVLAIHGDVGERVPVGSSLIEIELDDVEVTVPVRVDEAPLASPATRNRAKELGVVLSSVNGTGPDGRITADDLGAYLLREQVGQDPFTETKIIGLRRAIAERMQEAARRIPHFCYVEEFDLTALEELRRELNEDHAKISLLPFFMRALVEVLRKFPMINALYDDDAGLLRSYQHVHIGIATQTQGGLMVPVVRHAERRDIFDCARELGRVTTAARNSSATREELTGSTITISSLGALGGIAATPVINRPEVAILAPNRIIERPVVVNGKIVVRKMMNMSASFDHRIVDGYDAAQFVHELKRVIEHPVSLIVGRAEK